MSRCAGRACQALCCEGQVRKVQTLQFPRGGAAVAVPARWWTSLRPCSDQFPAVPGGASDLIIDKMFKV